MSDRPALPSAPDNPSFLDRRQHSRETPPCPQCSTPHVHVASRTDYVLYLRCPSCFQVWSIPKPGAQHFGS
jgi:hypothetical protein